MASVALSSLARLTVVVLLLGSGDVLAGPLVEAFAGASQSAAGTVTLVQDGVATTVPASWSSQPFKSPPYWAVRAGWAFPRLELSVELVHHKLILDSPPAPVQHFAVSHGFNLVLVSVATPLSRGVLGRAGLGVVVAHPESTVRGRAWGAGGPLEGFLLAGPVGAAGVERRWTLTGWLRFAVELALSAAWAQVPIAGGSARLPDFAAHLRLGLCVGR